MERNTRNSPQRFQIAYLHPDLEAADRQQTIMSPSARNEANLTAMLEKLRTVSATSTDAEFEAVASYFAVDGKFYLNGMMQPPVEGRAALVPAFKQLVQYWHIDEHRVLTTAYSADGKKIVHEMDNRLNIYGETIESFPETEVAEFDEQGLIASYHLYCDSSSIVRILVQKGVMPAPE
jgi:hypothetical protein